MKKITELEGFYLNNVKYIKCPAAQGAAIMNRHSKNSNLLGKFGLKQRGDFEQRRDWIFADREEDNATNSEESQDQSSETNSPSSIRGARISPGRDAELSTKFQSGSWSFGVFHKLRICIVDIQDKRKPDFKKIIETNGGKVILDLSRNKVDILLISHPSGINFQNSKLWNVACIHPDWIEKSIEAAMLLPLERYRVVEDSENSPPSNQKSSSPKVTTISSSGCFNFGQQETVSNSKSGLTIRSEGKKGKNTTTRITNDAFNVSTRL